MPGDVEAPNQGLNRIIWHWAVNLSKMHNEELAAEWERH
jgi:hypothetical protein